MPALKSKKENMSTVDSSESELYSYLKKPRVTEKASAGIEGGNVYVFEVGDRVNKIQVKKAVQKLYGVAPTKVNVSRVPSKVKVWRGKKGVRSGTKKVYVYLKEGDKIDIV